MQIQEHFDSEDRSIEFGDVDTQECARSWELFHEAAEGGSSPRQKARMDLVLEVRQKLKEYSKFEAVML